VRDALGEPPPARDAQRQRTVYSRFRLALTAAALAVYLRAFVGRRGRDHCLSGPGPLERGWRWCRRHPALASLPPVAAVLLVGLWAVLLLNPPLSPFPTDGSFRRVQEAGQLVIAVDPTRPPMEFKEGGRLTGFDVDFAEGLAAQLGVGVEFKEINWA